MEEERILVKCPLCDKEFDNVHALFGHMLTDHCDEEGYFIGSKGTPAQEEKPKEEKLKCPFCRKRFKYQEKLFRHIVLDHMDNLKAMYKEGSDNLKNQVIYIIEKAKEFGYLPEDFTLEEQPSESQEVPESSS